MTPSRCLLAPLCPAALAAVLVIGLLPATPPAAAQDGAGRGPGRAQDGGRGGFGRRRGGDRFGRMLAPDLLRRDMPFIVDELQLHEPQDDVVETLLLDYEAAFTEAAEAVRDRFQEIRPQQERSPEARQQRDDLRSKLREIRREAERLRESGEAVDPVAMKKVEAQLDEVRTELEALRPPRPDGAELDQLMEDMSALMSDWRLERSRLMGEFMMNLRAVLNEEQAEQLWPGFERALRRRKSLGRGQLSGEGVDLFQVLRDVGFSDEERWQLDEIMQEYALSLDQALVERDAHFETDRSDLLRAMRNGDIEQASLLLADESKLRAAVRGVNQRYGDVVAGAIAGTFDDERAAAFEQAYRQRAFPAIFRTTAMAQSFDAVVGLEELDAGVLESIAALRAGYESELGPMNDRLVQATLAHEPRRTLQRMERRAAARAGEEPGELEDPIRDGFEDRTALELRYRRQLEGLLTPEQVAMLPDPPRERERGYDRFRRRGGSDADRAERRERMLERFDRDGDGELSDDERSAAREEGRGRRDRDDDATR